MHATEITPKQTSAPVRQLLDDGELIQLRRWNTPTIYNGLEQYSRADRRSLSNLETVQDFMPQMGPMVGYAITVQAEPSNPDHPVRNPDAWKQYRQYIASIPGPKIVVVQDLDKPNAYGAFWGEVNSCVHRALGCIGTITDGAIRDTDEMNAAGFKALARCLCVGHAYSWPVKWGCDVEVFGTRISPGQLIHADKHGFLAVPLGEERQLLEASRFMDANESSTLIAACRHSAGKCATDILRDLEQAQAEFGAEAKKRFGTKGEW
jgi:regulator of RNase E activity RraA